MKAVIFSEFVKLAGYETYDYKASMSRNYIPDKSNVKVEVGDGSSVDDHKTVDIKPRNTPDLPKNGANKPSFGFDTPVGLQHQHARGTISGTGGGRRFWPDLKNGYEA